MDDQIPARITRLYGHEQARPKVTRVYKVSAGWSRVGSVHTATWPVIEKLLVDGVTSVELRWRLRTHQTSILDLRRRDVDAAADASEPSVAGGRRARRSVDSANNA